MIKEFALQRPAIRQILHGGDGTGREAMSAGTLSLRPKNEGARVARSVCPYCAVGCGQLFFHKDGKLVSIESDPESPISRGRQLSMRLGVAEVLFLNTLSFLLSPLAVRQGLVIFRRSPVSLGMFLLRYLGAARGGAMVAWRILDQPRPDSYVNL